MHRSGLSWHPWWGMLQRGNQEKIQKLGTWWITASQPQTWRDWLSTRKKKYFRKIVSSRIIIPQATALANIGQQEPIFWPALGPGLGEAHSRSTRTGDGQFSTKAAFWVLGVVLGTAWKRSTSGFGSKRKLDENVALCGYWGEKRKQEWNVLIQMINICFFLVVSDPKQCGTNYAGATPSKMKRLQIPSKQLQTIVQRKENKLYLRRLRKLFKHKSCLISKRLWID